MAISNNYLQTSPLSAFQQGFGFDNNLMQQILSRNQLSQQSDIEKAKQQQLSSQFQQDMSLKRGQLQRSLANDALNRQLVSEQIRNAREMHPVERALREAQAQQALASAKKSEMWSNLLSGQNVGGQGGMINPQGMMGATPMGSPISGGTTLGGTQSPSTLHDALSSMNAFNMGSRSPSSAESTITEGNPNMSQLDRMAGLPGMARIQTQTDKDGNLIKTYPSGKVTITRVGKTAEESARDTSLGKFEGETYKDAVNTSMALSNQQSNLERLADDLEKYPHPENVIGPINKHLVNLFGNPEDRKFLGDISGTTGNIVLDAAKGIKGAFTGRDQSLINSMKPNAGDNYWVFLGKLKSMGELNELAQRRSNIYADLVKHGIAPNEALSIAQSKSKIEPTIQKYQNLLKIADQKNQVYEGKMPSFSSKEEFQSFLTNLSTKDKLKLHDLMRK